MEGSLNEHACSRGDGGGILVKRGLKLDFAINRFAQERMGGFCQRGETLPLQEGIRFSRKGNLKALLKGWGDFTAEGRD